MTELFSRKIIILIAVLSIGTLWWWMGSGKTTPIQSDAQNQDSKIEQLSDKEVRIVSTKPEPLEEAVISATEEVEITFSHALENEGQFKVRIEPKTDYKIVLSGDRKTAKIIPQIPYELGAGYTLFILPDSKFDGVGEWRKEKIFHFQTIKYRGV